MKIWWCTCTTGTTSNALPGHYQMLPNVIKEMTELLTSAKEKMPQIKHQEMLYDMNNASFAIQEYKHHFRRHLVQSTDHEELFKECIDKDLMDGSRVILTIGELGKDHSVFVIKTKVFILQIGR